jgi:hypothetical protein
LVAIKCFWRYDFNFHYTYINKIIQNICGRVTFCFLTVQLSEQIKIRIKSKIYRYLANPRTTNTQFCCQLSIVPWSQEFNNYLSTIWKANYVNVVVGIVVFHVTGLSFRHCSLISFVTVQTGKSLKNYNRGNMVT